VDPLRELDGLVDSEARDEKRSLIEQRGDALDGLVIFTVRLDLVLKLLDNGALGRNFEGLLGLHV